MNNSQISNKLKYLAALKFLLDENKYKISAFEKAANIVDLHPEEMGILIDEDRLKTVPGIGESLAHLILYYAKAGTTSLEKELIGKLPEGLPDLLELKGLGVKKVKTLWRDHQINNLSELETVCQSHQLSKWKGFGDKLEQNLLDGITFLAKHKRDFYLDIAKGVAKAWLEKLVANPYTIQVEFTGQIRRSNELISSIDFLVEGDLQKLKTELSSTFPNVIIESNQIKFSDVSGLPINIWFASKADFPAHQLILTGGKTYLEVVDAALEIQGLVRSASGITNLKVQSDSEKKLCDQLDIQWIEPVLRDNHQSFPTDRELIRSEDIKGVLHAHSTWSDGRNSLEEMVIGAQKLGYQYIGISDHSQAAHYANGLKPDRVRAQWDRIDELNQKHANIHIFKGIEADILKDGALDYDEELLDAFDFVIASVHSNFHLSPNQQTDRIIRAMQSPFTTILGHPTGRMLLAREGYAPDIPTIIDAAAAYSKVIEINTTPKRLDLDWRYLKLARSKGVKLSVNPDAHSLQGLESIPLGVTIAQKGGLSAEDVINTLELPAFKTNIRNWRNR